ncbi:hypothetical protein ACHHYP_05906 [Achlya hypogyna]|uniref:Uncharacterized protein n=1 Tax=Achlya hypogyna TaxID=1202772 RepID=A0A1V9YWC1_ACHHY|nr:hypothetical protein ACHHYP_05906 [Achlya hypogyna]
MPSPAKPPSKGSSVAPKGTPAKGSKKNDSAVTLPKINTPKSSTPKGSPSKPPSKMEKMPSLDKTELTPRLENAATVDVPVVVDTAALEAATLAQITADAEAATAAAAEEANKAAAAAKAAEEAAELAKKRNGNVILKYEMYDEAFPIVDGSTTMAAIDDVYALTFVMPNCLVHLSRLDPPSKVAAEASGVDVYIKELPEGTYQDLEAGETYYVYVEQEAEQLARDQAKMREVAATMDGVAWQAPSTTETCSCVNGNPCVDEYNCKDWHNRFAVATAHGWKGF